VPLGDLAADGQTDARSLVCVPVMKTLEKRE
jgi:hypothetical protein